MHVDQCTCVRRHLNETVLWGNITWSEIGKQNIQAKKVYSFLSGNGPYQILFPLDEQISPTSDCNNNNYSSNLKSDLDSDDLLEVCVSVYD